MKDEKAIKHLNKLGEYCDNPERELCYGCVFENVRYGDENRCPIALALSLTKDLRNERKE